MIIIFFPFLTPLSSLVQSYLGMMLSYFSQIDKVSSQLVNLCTGPSQKYHSLMFDMSMPMLSVVGSDIDVCLFALSASCLPPRGRHGGPDESSALWQRMCLWISGTAGACAGGKTSLPTYTHCTSSSLQDMFTFHELNRSS